MGYFCWNQLFTGLSEKLCSGGCGILALCSRKILAPESPKALLGILGTVKKCIVFPFSCNSFFRWRRTRKIFHWAGVRIRRRDCGHLFRGWRRGRSRGQQRGQALQGTVESGALWIGTWKHWLQLRCYLLRCPARAMTWRWRWWPKNLWSTGTSSRR